MQIRNYYNVIFGSKHLYSAVLSKKELFGREKKIPVYISELEYADIERMRNDSKKWGTTDYGKLIIDKFIRDCSLSPYSLGITKRYYIVETLRGTTKAVANAEDLGRNNLYLTMLQSERQKLGSKTLNGAGNCILYALSKLADSSGKDFVVLQATEKSKNFYEKAGFERLSRDSFRYYLSKSLFPEFEKRMEQKYSIKPVI